MIVWDTRREKLFLTIYSAPFKYANANWVYEFKDSNTLAPDNLCVCVLVKQMYCAHWTMWQSICIEWLFRWKKNPGSNKKLITTCERTRKEFNNNNNKQKKTLEHLHSPFSIEDEFSLEFRAKLKSSNTIQCIRHFERLYRITLNGTRCPRWTDMTVIAFRIIIENTCTQCVTSTAVVASLQSHDIHILHAFEHIMWFGHDSEWHSCTSHIRTLCCSLAMDNG